MPTLQEMNAISDPTVRVNGNTIQVVPNSVKMTIPGETTVRAMSAGGGQIVPVAGLNAEELKGMVGFGLPNTPAAIKAAREWRASTNAGQPVSITIEDRNAQFSFQYMFMTSKVEVPFEHDGTMDIEFEGSYVE